jgi:hypothetical protein
MPPEQSERFLNIVDNRFGLGAHLSALLGLDG